MIDILYKNKIIISFQTDEIKIIDLAVYIEENYERIRNKIVNEHLLAIEEFMGKINEDYSHKQKYLSLILNNVFEYSTFKKNRIYDTCIKIALEEINYEYLKNNKVVHDNDLNKMQDKNKFKLIKFINSILNLSKMILYFINILMIRGGQYYKEKKSISAYKSIFIEYFLNFKILEIKGKKKYHSNQTGYFIDRYEDENNTCRLQISTRQIPFYKINNELKTTFKDVDNLYSIHYFQTFKNKIYIFIDSLILYSIYLKTLKKLPEKFKKMFEGNASIHNFYIDYYNFKSLENSIHKYEGNKIYFVSESQNWELALAKSLDLESNKSNLIINLFVHAPIRSWDMRFQTLKNKINCLDLKKIKLKYYVTCNSDLKFMNKIQGDNVTYELCSAFRYEYLTTINFNNKICNIKGKYIIGIIFDYSSNNVIELSNIIKKFNKKFGYKYKFLCKFHPANSNKSKNTATKIFTEHSGDIKSFLEKCNLIICSSSTSASIDVKYYGIKCTTYLGFELNLNSYDDLKSAIFTNESELYKIIDEHNKNEKNINCDNNPLGLELSFELYN